MANLNRYAGNLLPFASNSTGTNRTTFGSIVQSDDIDDNINADFLLGWEIVSASEAPTKQDFNALGYTTSLLVAYLYQKGIPEWDASQEYHIDARQIGDKSVGSDGMVYSSLIDTNTGNDPVGDLTNWLSDFSLYSVREVTHNITVDADYTLTDAQNFYKRIVITDTNPFLSTARNIIVNNIEREFIVKNDTLQTLTIKTSLGTGISILPGLSAPIRCDGVNIVSHDPFLYDIDISLTGNGYQKLSNGLIIQWGENTTPASLDLIVNFPIAFPNSVFMIQGNFNGATEDDVNVTCTDKTLSSFRLSAWVGGSLSVATRDCGWIAIGN